MAKLSDIFGRKTGEETSEKIIPLAPIAMKGVEGPAIAPADSTVDMPVDIGSIGRDNELLRNLLSDTGRKIGELEELKHSFERLVSPVNGALRALEQEKSLALNLSAQLDEQRRAFDALRDQFYAVEKKANQLEAELEKLQNELELARESGRATESERLQLAEGNKARDVQIADLMRRLEQETAQSHSASESRSALQGQVDRAEKRIVELEGELAAAREHTALLEGERQSVQQALDQALAETARLTRRMSESENTLSATRAQLARIEANYAEASSDRGRLAVALDEAKEQHQSERNTLTMRLDGMQSRAATAERLLAETRQALIARTEEARSFDRKAVEASIARTAAERRLQQLESAQEGRERQIRDLETTRNTLTDNNGALSKTLRAREMALSRAEEKVAELTARTAQLEADLRVSRSAVDKRIEDLRTSLERERLDRAVADGALEGARKDNDRLHAELARLRTSLGRGPAEEAAKPEEPVEEAPPLAAETIKAAGGEKA